MKGANTTSNKIFFNNTYSPVSLYTYHAAKTLHCKITIREKIAVKAQRGCGCFEDNIANRKHENGKRKRKMGERKRKKRRNIAPSLTTLLYSESYVARNIREC